MSQSDKRLRKGGIALDIEISEFMQININQIKEGISISNTNGHIYRSG